jgi:hypothetical protein
MCNIYLAKGNEPVACGLGPAVCFATLASEGRTSHDEFHPLRQAERLIPAHVRGTI